MLLLVTILLVLVAAVTLLIGIFSDSLPLIFISIGASGAAAIVLAVLSQVTRRRGGEAPAAAGQDAVPTREPALVGASDGVREEASIAEVGEPVGAFSDAPTTTMSTMGTEGPPIDGYDRLRVNEILPALDDLDLDQLEAVAQYEESNKNRTTVLNRIDDLMDELEAEESATPSPTAADATVVEAIEEVGEPVVAPEPEVEDEEDDDGFPIAGFDDLDEDELIGLLDDLDADELEVVADREEAGLNRDAVLDAIDDRLDILEGIVPAPAPVKATPSKKTPAKRTATPTATKTPARKPAASARPAKAPARKTSATKSPARKATTTTATRKGATPAKRTPPAPARKATPPAKKAPSKSTAAARKGAAPAKRPAPAAKKSATTARKAAPVKKAATTARKAAPVKKSGRR